MIIVVEKNSYQANADLLQQMFRLRARIFYDRLKWDVSVVNGLERDKFDEHDPLYIISIDNEDRVNASCRILPTTQPTLVSEFFYDTMPDAAQMTSPSIWECSRFCVDCHESQFSSQASLHLCGVMLAQIGVLALKSGIETVIGNFDDGMLRLYRRIGSPVQVLGCTNRYEKSVYLGSFQITPEIVTSGLQRFPANFSNSRQTMTNRVAEDVSDSEPQLAQL